MDTNQQKHRLDPSIFLNDGPWEAYDALCRDVHKCLNENRWTRYIYPAGLGVVSLGAIYTVLLWWLGLSYFGSFVALVIVSLGLLGLYVKFRSQRAEMPLETIVAIAAAGVIFSAVVVFIAARFGVPDQLWTGSALVGGGGVWGAFYADKWLRKGTFARATVLSEMASALGFKYTSSPAGLPDGTLPPFGPIYRKSEVGHVFHGTLDRMPFLFARYEAEDDPAVHFMIVCENTAVNARPFELTTHGVFPDEGEGGQAPSGLAGSEYSGKYRVRWFGHSHDADSDAVVARLIESIAPLVKDQKCYVAAADSRVMVFIQEDNDLFVFDEMSLIENADPVFAELEREFALAIRLISALGVAKPARGTSPGIAQD